jgi:hypothetical protein
MKGDTTMTQTLGEDQRPRIDRVEIEATARPSASSLLPNLETPETRDQRLGVRRNGAYKEKVTTHEVDPQEREERRRALITLALEVALAMMLTLAARLWDWAREERARARADRSLRMRIPAT